MSRRSPRSGLTPGLSILLALLPACATVPSVQWAPDPFPRIDLPALPAPGPSSPVDTRPGWVEIEEETLDWLLGVEALYDPARGALLLCYEGREEDRAEARAIMAALEVQRAEARRGQLRAFGVGAGVGGGLVLGVVLGVALGVR